MRYFGLVGLLVLVVLSGCLFLDAESPDGGVQDEIGYITSEMGFVFSEGNTTSVWDKADICLEPWWDNGVAVPAIQATWWGDSSSIIYDLGALTIDEAMDMSPEEGSISCDEWTIWPVDEGHVYTFVDKASERVYMRVDSVYVQADEETYDATIWFTYRISTK